MTKTKRQHETVARRPEQDSATAPHPTDDATTTRTDDAVATGPDQAITSRPDDCGALPGFPVVPCLVLIVAVLAYPTITTIVTRSQAPPQADWMTEADPSTEVTATIDPETAPWQELASLPRIGVGKALAIVAFRQAQREMNSGRVFQSADDLAAVKGIGPGTVEMIRPYLHFGDDDLALTERQDHR